MTSSTSSPNRKPRADAARNRDRLLEAAQVVFSAGGQQASLEAVAREANVGIGTLYRHFPTRRDLFEAVYRREVQQLCELAETLSYDGRPTEALRSWLRSNVEFVATKKGMSTALAMAVDANSDLTTSSLALLLRAVDSLLAPAVEAGEVRGDVTAEDLLRTLVGMCYMQDRPDWQVSVLRMLDVVIDGLRTPSAPSPNSTTKRSSCSRSSSKRKPDRP